jgi:hypothetical protein
MPSCAACGTAILFGGVRRNGRTYCKAQCAARDALNVAADEIPEDEIAQHLELVHQGPCPKCQGPGPVDVHSCHTIQSFVVMTRFKSTPIACCRACAKRHQMSAIASSAALGWWGFPFGVIGTPIQILRNLAAMTGGPKPDRPSAELQKLVRLTLGAELHHLRQQEQRRLQGEASRLAS